MKSIELKPIPNQLFSVTIGDYTYGLHFKTSGTMLLDFYVDEVLVAQSIKCRPNVALIPYDYLVDGNFFIVTENEEYPDYLQFGTAQKLYYLTDAEISAL